MQPDPPRIPPHPDSWLDKPMDPNLPAPSSRPRPRERNGLLIGLIGVLLVCVGCVAVAGIGGLVVSRSAASSGFFPTVQAAIAATLTATAGPPGPPTTPIAIYRPPQTTPRPTNTPGPTKAPTATMTPRPTGTPTPPRPAATAIPQVQLAVANVNTFRDTFGDLWVIGEVANSGQLDAGDIEVVVTLLGEGDRALDTKSLSFITIGLPILKPGEMTVWRGRLGRPPAELREVRAQAQGKPASSFTRGSYYFDLEAEKVAFQPPATQSASVTASGRVVSTSAVALGSVQVVIGAYDEAGTLLRVEETDVSFRGVSPGNAVPFALTFPDLKRVPARYEIYLSARR